MLKIVLLRNTRKTSGALVLQRQCVQPKTNFMTSLETQTALPLTMVDVLSGSYFEQIVSRLVQYKGRHAVERDGDARDASLPVLLCCENEF